MIRRPELDYEGPGMGRNAGNRLYGREGSVAGAQILSFGGRTPRIDPRPSSPRARS
jgi:hypothetical protein